ncbi:DUF1294 domain-containing protein [Cryobacterium melibiosiphilum]|uniref:DUF1294 domain-containing protein n=1 Tax=Cryobacterium melibiosiphilum TaxID=995039 RepID=A0A3A5MKH2_9MICO|nr:DUF1294 domain-containing protein [Cryobacterium melibiosiphilum]RJT90607.1 DUF1294 domain-containing protein [Cryobacterium melibiosiphilum]
MSATVKRVDGHLTQWNDTRGFGFLTPLRGHDHTFVHISAFPHGAGRPRLGEVYSFAITVNGDGKQQAIDLQPEGRGSGTPRRSVPVRSGPRPGVRPAARSGAGRSRAGSAGYLAIVVFAAAAVTAGSAWPVPFWVAAGVGSIYLAMSVVCFVAYAVDKRAAVAGRWRVSESTLLTLGLLGGWPGAIIAQQTLRHKTQKASFRRAFWGTVVLNVLVYAAFATPLWSWFVLWTTQGMP